MSPSQVVGAVAPTPGGTYSREDESQFRAMVMNAIQQLGQQQDGYATGTAAMELDASGNLILAVSSSDSDTYAAYYEISTSLFVEPTVDSDEILATAMPYSEDTLVDLAVGQTAYLWLKFYSTEYGFGQEVKLTKTNTSSGPLVLTLALRAVPNITAKTMAVHAVVTAPSSGFFNASMVIYRDQPGTAAGGTALVSHTFTASGQSVGPVGAGGGATEYAALTGIVLPKVGLVRIWAHVTDAYGNQYWFFSGADLDSLPGGSVAIRDFRANPQLVCYYDDDVAYILVNVPGGKAKTYTIASPGVGGSETYTVGTTVLDDTTTETALAPHETRGTYEVIYYGVEAAGGQTFKALASSYVHGSRGAVPSIVIESEGEASDVSAVSAVATFVRASYRDVAGAPEAWATIRGGNGTGVQTLTGSVQEARIFSSTTTNLWARFYRVGIGIPTTGFDETTVPTSPTYVSVTYGSKQDGFTGSVAITGVSADLGNLASDYQKASNTLYSATTYTLASIAASGTLTFALNQAGLDALAVAIAARTPFYFMVRIEDDASNTEPTWASGVAAVFGVYNATHGSHDTKVVVTGTVTAAKVILRHDDPSAVTEAIQYLRKFGDVTGSWTTLVDNTSVPVPTGLLTDYPITVPIFESPLSWIQARVKYVIDAVTYYTSPITSSGFDTGHLPNVVIRPTADKDWNVSAEVTGDFDTNSIRLAVASGVAPARPSRATVQAASVLAGRTFTTDDISFAYGDVPVELAAGQKVIFAVLGYTDTAGTTGESTNVVYAEIARPPEFGASDPTIDSLVVSATDDTSGGVDVVATWTCSNVVDATHDMDVAMEWPPEVDTAYYETDLTPDNGGGGGDSLTHNFGGLGAGGGSEIPATTKCKVTVTLKAGSTELDSMTKYTVGIAV